MLRIIPFPVLSQSQLLLFTLAHEAAGDTEHGGNGEEDAEDNDRLRVAADEIDAVPDIGERGQPDVQMPGQRAAEAHGAEERCNGEIATRAA